MEQKKNTLKTTGIFRITRGTKGAGASTFIYGDVCEHVLKKKRLKSAKNLNNKWNGRIVADGNGI